MNEEKYIRKFLEAGTKELGIDCSILVGTVCEIVRQAESRSGWLYSNKCDNPACSCHTTPTSAEGPQCTHNVQEAKWVCRDCGKVADDMQEHAHKALVAHAKEEGYDRAKSEAGHTYSRDRYDNDIKEAFEEGRATAQRETVEKVIKFIRTLEHRRWPRKEGENEDIYAYINAHTLVVYLQELAAPTPEQPPKE